MKAQELLNARIKQGDDAFAELRVWHLPKPVRGSTHPFKYRLAFVTAGVCVLRFDNEAGKGDHCRIGSVETRYTFTSVDNLLADFWRHVDDWRR
jgi:hypothetical protein